MNKMFPNNKPKSNSIEKEKIVVLAGTVITKIKHRLTNEEVIDKVKETYSKFPFVDKIRIHKFKTVDFGSDLKTIVDDLINYNIYITYSGDIKRDELDEDYANLTTELIGSKIHIETNFGERGKHADHIKEGDYKLIYERK